MSLHFSNISKSFSAKRVLDVVELRLPMSGITAILGPSGCGKTTLLRIAAGLETADSGSIAWQDGSGDSAKLMRIDQLAPAAREISLVMQQPVVTPHWTVEEHLRFPLEQMKLSSDEIAERIRQTAEVLELTDRMKQMARELSGGQQQRVALGRAMVRRARGLLLDEPLSQLDRPLRVKLQKTLRDEIIRLGTSAIWVTHDVTEAIAVADHLVVMIGGKVVQSGTPAEVQKQPASDQVAELLG